MRRLLLMVVGIKIGFWALVFILSAAFGVTVLNVLQEGFFSRSALVGLVLITLILLPFVSIKEKAERERYEEHYKKSS